MSNELGDNQERGRKRDGKSPGWHGSLLAIETLHFIDEEVTAQSVWPEQSCTAG